MEARVLCIKLTEDRCFGKRSSEPMIFATFQAFEVFRLLTILRLFDDLDESTTVSSALPPPLTTSLVPSSLGAKSDNPVVFNIEVSGVAIHLKPLGSNPPRVGIDTSTRRVKPPFKATGTGS